MNEKDLLFGFFVVLLSALLAVFLTNPVSPDSGKAVDKILDLERRVSELEAFMLDNEKER